MLTLVGVGIFVAVIAVKLVKPCRILGEMCRNPVEYHAYSVSVAVIYKFHKIRGSAET